MVTARRPLEESPSRHWTFPCPVCGRHVRVNRNRTVAAHFTPAATPTYCAGSREPAVYPHDGRS